MVSLIRGWPYKSKHVDSTESVAVHSPSPPGGVQLADKFGEESLQEIESE